MGKLSQASLGATIAAAVAAATIEPPLWALALIAAMAWATLALVLWEEKQPKYKRHDRREQ